MFIFWDDNSPKTSLMLCITIALVVILLWYISNQKYNTACDRRIINMQLLDKENNSDNKTEYMTLPDTKKKLDPEKNISYEHSMGDTIYNAIKTVDDPLSLDGILQIQTETEKQLLERSNNEEYDAPQLEGMYSAIDAMEESWQLRQKK